jgi:hypothetical protein
MTVESTPYLWKHIVVEPNGMAEGVWHQKTIPSCTVRPNLARDAREMNSSS